MDALFQPATSPADGLALVHTYLGRRWRRWWAARRLLPAGLRAELPPLLAWFELHRECETLQGIRRERLWAQLNDEIGEVYASPLASISHLGSLIRGPLLRLEVSELALRKPLAALEDLSRRGVFASRSELVGLARRLADPEAQVLVALAGLTDDRSRLLATALATGLKLAGWTVRLPEDLRRGRVFLPLEEVTRHGLALDQLEESPGDPRLHGLVGEQIARARGELAKGWPLAADLGAYRGRCLSFVLRWHAAALSAIEARDNEVFPSAARAGWPRLLACLAASVASTRPPF